MAEDEIRSFEVSDPRKSFAGHTVYRVSAKVYKKGSPGLIEEVIVWRRFSEFKRFQKDLLKLYKPIHGESQFPHLPRATFFDRFDETVIEERRKSSLSLLTFVGNIPQIAKSQCFRNFFEGGIYQRTACSSNSSRGSSLSSNEGETTESRITDKKSVTLDPDEGQGYLDLGGVWLCKQPSLVEGLDKTETAVDETIPDRTMLDDKVDSPIDTPSFIQRSLSDEGSEEDVFEDKESENNEEVSCDTDEEEKDSKQEKTCQWFERAISLCSEGDDIEALASEAENDEYVKELNFPKPFSEFAGENEAMKQLEENERLSKREGCDKKGTEKFISFDNVQSILNTEGNIGVESKRESKKVQSECRERILDESGEATYSSKGITQSKDKYSHSAPTLKQSQNKTEYCRFDPQDTSILADSMAGDDYLFAAAKVVRLALNCEVEGEYREAFHLYKRCVSLLLSGVQEEKDAKRRDAVRRKTAQYLLKAEALYTAYVHESVEDFPGNPSQSPDTGEDSNREQFGHLQLAEYSVIGVIGKVMLVENRSDQTTYVVKVLPKTEDHHLLRHKSQVTKRKKNLITAAYTQCPFIVKLYQHCETRTSVILLLEHARGGLLWDYLTPLTRRQHQHISATSKSQCYVHNLKETELNKIFTKTLHHSLGKDSLKDNQKTKFLDIGARQDKEIPSNTGYHKTEQISHSSRMDDLNIQPANDKITTFNSSLQTNDSKNIPESCKKISTFASLDESFRSPSQKAIESYVRIWMAEIILALAHLHSNGIICRDLNPKNILLSDEGHVLLTHFSIWEDVIEESDSLEEEYCAPELFKLEEVTTAADWWSVGALFYEMLTGQSLTRSYPWGIRSHTEIETTSNISAEATALIQELLIVTPSERLGSGVNGLDDIKSHPFFSSVDWSTLETKSIPKLI